MTIQREGWKAPHTCCLCDGRAAASCRSPVSPADTGLPSPSPQAHTFVTIIFSRCTKQGNVQDQREMARDGNHCSGSCPHHHNSELRTQNPSGSMLRPVQFVVSMMRIIPKELQAKRKMLEKAMIGLRFSQLGFAPVLLLEEFWVTSKAQEQKNRLDPGESFLAESFSPVTPAKFHLPRLNSVLPEPSGCGEAAAGGCREDETSCSPSYPLEQQVLH